MTKLLFIFSLLLSVSAAADIWQEPPEVGYTQNLGAELPRQLALRDTRDTPITLDDLLGSRPLILGMGYNDCPMLCGEQLQGLLQALTATGLTAGEDYAVAFVSVNPDEDLSVTAGAEEKFLHSLGSGNPEAVHFLRGDKAAIDKLAGVIGFEYTFVESTGQYAHPAGWVIVSPEGRIVNYELGVRYESLALERDIRAAQRSEVGEEKPSLLLRCLQYDPLQGPYGQAIKASLKTFAVLTILGMIGFIIRYERKRKDRR